MAATAAGAAPGSRMGLATTCFMTARRPQDTLEFLEYCHSLGAGGVQAPLASLDAGYVKRLRARAEEHGMFFEAMAGLPRADGDGFAQTVAAAKEAGALAIRAASPGPRRYEAFASLDDWKRAAAASRLAISRALPVLEKHKIPLALENHRDRTAEELVSVLEEYRSEYLGVCLDTGNNIALLENPAETVDLLARYAVSTHIKDMAVEEDRDGFLLAEVPLGEGFLDLRRIAGAISAARPGIRMILEMITRDPTPVPCLTDKYWAALPNLSGLRLARALALVRANRPRQPLARVGGLDRAAQLQLEEENVRRSLAWAGRNPI
jgi:sugar phosphate isomerase/epimerase